MVVHDFRIAPKIVLFSDIHDPDKKEDSKVKDEPTGKKLFS